MTYAAGYIPRWFTCAQAVAHRSINSARRRVTSLSDETRYRYATPPTQSYIVSFFSHKRNCSKLLTKHVKQSVAAGRRQSRHTGQTSNSSSIVRPCRSPVTSPPLTAASLWTGQWSVSTDQSSPCRTLSRGQWTGQSLVHLSLRYSINRRPRLPVTLARERNRKWAVTSRRSRATVMVGGGKPPTTRQRMTVGDWSVERMTDLAVASSPSSSVNSTLITGAAHPSTHHSPHRHVLW